MRDYSPVEPRGGVPERRPGVYLAVGVLVAIPLAAGLLFYTPPAQRTDQLTQLDQPRTPALPPAVPRD